MADPTPARSEPCPGPLIWFDADPLPDEPRAAVLECATCGYVIATGSFHDERHAETALFRSPS